MTDEEKIAAVERELDPPLIPGDIVELRTGGPKMTLEWIEKVIISGKITEDLATCGWFEGQHPKWIPRRCVFALCKLQLVHH